jgi:hypothetical protein
MMMKLSSVCTKINSLVGNLHDQVIASENSILLLKEYPKDDPFPKLNLGYKMENP